MEADLCENFLPLLRDKVALSHHYCPLRSALVLAMLLCLYTREYGRGSDAASVALSKLRIYDIQHPIYSP